MPESDLANRSKMLEATLAAHRRHRDKNNHLDLGAGLPPRTGDAYDLSLKTNSESAWGLVAQDPTNGRFLAVPCDAGTMVGTADVVVSDDPIAAPRIARCRYAIWLDEETIRAGRRIAVLSEVAVARIRGRWHDLGDRRAKTNILMQDVDEDPEYEDWLRETIEAQYRELRERIAAEHKAQPTPPPQPGPGLPRRYAVAVALVLTIGASLGGLHLRRQDQHLQDLASRIDRAEERRQADLKRAHSEHRAAIDRLTAEDAAARAELESIHRSAAEVLRQARKKAVSELRQHVSDLTQRLDSATLAAEITNPVLAFLERERSLPGKTIELPADASHVFLELSVPFDSAPRYRVSVFEASATEPLWTHDRLRSGGKGVLWIGLPVGLLPPGEYRVQRDAWVDHRFQPDISHRIFIKAKE